MSNLSELLPAGAGAKSADFVASGTLGSGVTVALKADGTVEAVSGYDTSLAASSSVVSGNMDYRVSAYDSIQNKIVISYSGVSNYGTAVVGTVTGTSISFGTPAVFYSGPSYYQTIAFDENAGKFLICYSDWNQGEYGKAVVATISGTSISFGSVVTFSSTSTPAKDSTYDASQQKIIISYDTGSTNFYCRAATISGTSVSFGTAYSVYGDDSGYHHSICYNAAAQKSLIVYGKPASSNSMASKVVTLSGTTISFGSEVVVYDLAVVTNISCTYDPNSQQNIVGYLAGGTSYDLVAGSISGTSVTYGNATSTGVNISNAPAIGNLSFDVNANKIVLFGRDTGNGYYATYIIGSVAGTSITTSSPVAVSAYASYGQTVVYDSTSTKTVLVWPSGYSNPVAAVLTVGASNNTDFIGITDQAIADTATGAVIVQGGVSDKVTGLTANTDYYVQANGTISATVSTVPAGRALSSTSILLEG